MGGGRREWGEGEGEQRERGAVFDPKGGIPEFPTPKQSFRSSFLPSSSPSSLLLPFLPPSPPPLSPPSLSFSLLLPLPPSLPFLSSLSYGPSGFTAAGVDVLATVPTPATFPPSCVPRARKSTSLDLNSATSSCYVLQPTHVDSSLSGN